MAVWIGSIFPHMEPVLHIVLAMVAAALMGAFWAAIAGWLRAVVGTHEVISTIMLNWIAIWVATVPVPGRRAAAEHDARPGTRSPTRSSTTPTFR